jgi:hypothetical protein
MQHGSSVGIVNGHRIAQKLLTWLNPVSLIVSGRGALAKDLTPT